MAAPPAKPDNATADISPVDTTAEDKQLKDPPMPPTLPLKPPPRTYEEAEASEYFTTAKALLQSGSFEDALAVLEKGMESFRGSGEDDALHPSLAPFHYLYGTTLLYSIEETADVAAGNAEQVEEETELAWQHLEVARTMQETLNRPLALAQTLLRQGDLNRMNGREQEAVQDLQRCLDLRLANMKDMPYDRKLADVHYQLALARQNLVTAGPKDEKESNRVAALGHFYDCGVCLGGQMAIAAGLDAQVFLRESRSKIDRLKDDNDEGMTTKARLQALVESSQELQPQVAGDATFEELRGLLQEIYEAVAEAKQSEEGVNEATALKEQMKALVAEKHEQEDINPFGQPTMTNVVAQPLVARKKDKDDGKPAAAEAVQPVTLVARKKPKRDAEDTKLPGDPAKRPRSE